MRIPSFDQLADGGGHAVIPEAAGMDRGRHKRMPQAVHGQQRGIFGGIAVIIDKRCFGQGRAAGGLHRINFNLLAVDFIQNKGEGQAREIAAAAGAADDDVRIFI